MDLRVIKNRILELRGFRVMLDFHLAELYQVEARALNQAVKRNFMRFPKDFMMRLTLSEWKRITNSSQFVMSSRKHRGTRYVPYAFTEQGVAMLSSVLRSERAIDVNIAIMRAFVLLRQHISDHKDLKARIRKLEKEMNRKFKNINEALHYLLSPVSKPARIGFRRKAENL